MANGQSPNAERAGVVITRSWLTGRGPDADRVEIVIRSWLAGSALAPLGSCREIVIRSWPLRDLLVRLLPGWEVEIQTYTVGIRGSHDPDRWYAQMRQLEVTAAQAERLMQDMVEQALTELTDIYSVRYAALQHANHA